MEILNLANYINIFSGCAINIINYKGINIPSSISVPVWTTRYNIVDFCIFMTPFTKRPPIKYKIFLIDHFNNSKFPSCVAFEANREIPLRSNAGQQRAWKCLTRFYIFPPTKQFAGVLPPDLYEEHFSSRRKMIPYYRTGYHVLVQDAESYFRIWINEMQILLNENSGLNMLLMLVNDNVVSNFQFCCRYCHGCFQVCHDIGNEKLDELEIAKVAYGFNTMGDKTLWVIRGNWNYLKNGSIKFSEIGKDTVKIDSTLINLFLGGNVSAKLGRGYSYSFEREPHILSNSTFMQNQCLSSHTNHPTINMKAQFRVELVTSVRRYGFLSCSTRRTPKTSLENLIYVFSWPMGFLL